MRTFLSIILIPCVCVCVYLVLGMESRASCMLDKCSTTELHPQLTVGGGGDVLNGESIWMLNTDKIQRPRDKKKDKIIQKTLTRK